MEAFHCLAECNQVHFTSGGNQCFHTMVYFSSLKQALSFHLFIHPSSYSICTPHCMSEFDPLVMVAIAVIMVLLNQWVLLKLK